MERLHKVLAAAGVASRRDCEALISAGRVKLNGQVVQELGTRIDPMRDQVHVDDTPVPLSSKRVYVMLNKPVGVVSTADDPQGRPTVVGLVDSPVRLFPVGRLDASSEGLLLLTNDGELTHGLTHPRFAVEKEYQALLDRMPSDEALRTWRNGVLLDGKHTAPAQVDVLEKTDEGCWLRVVLREGRKRQIREVASLLGHEVQRLIRVREGDLHLGDLPAGQWRKLSAEEVQSLRKHLTAHGSGPSVRDVRDRQPSRRSHSPTATTERKTRADSPPPRKARKKQP